MAEFGDRATACCCRASQVTVSYVGTLAGKLYTDDIRSKGRGISEFFKSEIMASPPPPTSCVLEGITKPIIRNVKRVCFTGTTFF